ncbi:MAG TPA: fibronectin type III domain-containing protein [Bacteroidia bacterium]|jgi:hypothetical protein|nr:fibronectin type III domain-containing protein [Bacteroidia bacterium]
MTTVQKKVPKKEAALKLGKLSVAQVITTAKHYVQSMTGNTNFPAPTPALSVISAQIAALEAAVAIAQTRVRGSVGKMNTERKALTTLLLNLASYVQTIANADPENSGSIINSAGMDVKKPSQRASKTFSVVLSKTIPNAVVLNTKAVSRSSYIYEVTTDTTNPNGWTVAITSNTVKYVKTGFTSGTRYYFRVAVVTKNIQGPWSPVLNVIIP